MKAVALFVVITLFNFALASEKHILFQTRDNTKAVAITCIKHEENPCGKFEFHEGLGKSIEALEYKALGEQVWASNMVNIKRLLKLGNMVDGKYFAPGLNLTMKWRRGLRDGDDPLYSMLIPLVPFMVTLDLVSLPVQGTMFVVKYFKSKEFRQQRRQRRDARRILRRLRRFVVKQKASSPRKVTEASYTVFRNFLKAL